MPIYEFRCPQQHLHELMMPMSVADRTAPCPTCGEPSRRLISSPKLSHLNSPRAQAISRAEASASAPTVVDSIPSAGNPKPVRTTRDPRHAKLPRP